MILTLVELALHPFDGGRSVMVRIFNFFIVGAKWTEKLRDNDENICSTNP